MTNKIEISRELAVERLTEIANRDSAVSVTVRAEDLRALLAAPAFEHQEPVAWVDAEIDSDKGKIIDWNIGALDELPHGTKLCASPPEPVSNEQPVAYMRNEVTPNNLVLCSFNDPGAFGVYRGPKSAPVAVVLDERAAFEKTVIDMADRFHPDLSKYGIDGEYKHAQLQYAWDLWQVRACLDKVKEMHE